MRELSKQLEQAIYRFPHRLRVRVFRRAIGGVAAYVLAGLLVPPDGGAQAQGLPLVGAAQQAIQLGLVQPAAWDHGVALTNQAGAQIVATSEPFPAPLAANRQPVAGERDRERASGLQEGRIVYQVDGAFLAQWWPALTLYFAVVVALVLGLAGFIVSVLDELRYRWRVKLERRKSTASPPAS